MPSISSTYLLPAIILNPAFILHLINTFVSHYMPPPPTVSRSPHPTFERLGPLPGSTPYLDMHDNDQLCWGYTILMVLVQVVAFGRVQDNRSAKKIAKAAKIEKSRKEKLEKAQAERKEVMSKLNGIMGEIDGKTDCPTLINISENGNPLTAHASEHLNGLDGSKTFPCTESEGSLTETSEEEMMI